MKRQLFIFIILLLSVNSFSQTLKAKRGNPMPFMADERLFTTIGPETHFYFNNTLASTIFGAGISPELKLNSLLDSKVRFSVGTNLSVGYDPAPQEDSLTYIFFGSPIYLNFNVGHLSSKLIHQGAAINFGIGYDYGVIRNDNQYGVLFMAGFRTYLGGLSVSIRYKGSISNDPEAFNVHGILLHFGLGRYIKKAKMNKKLLDFNQPIYDN